MNFRKEKTSRSALRCGLAGLLGLAIAVAGPSSAVAQHPTALPPQALSWNGDPSAPNISGIWVRSGTEGNSESKEGWLPWPPPLKGKFAEIWKKRVADAKAGVRTDEPERACLPAGMPRFVTGMTSPMLILQTPGRVMMYREGMAVRRIWVDGRPLPTPDELESFYNGNAIGRYTGSDLVTEVAGIRDQPVDSTGVPHSDDLKIVERFNRVDANTLKLTVTITDKTAFTRTMVSTVIYKLHENPAWEPKEFLCTPQTDYHADSFVR